MCYHYLKDNLNNAKMMALEAEAKDDLEARIEQLKLTMDIYSNSNYPFEAKCCKMQVKLLKVQLELEQLSGEEVFLNLSLADTLYNCFLLGYDKRAKLIKSAFEFSDKHYWVIKAKALGSEGRWTDIRKLAVERVKYLPSKFCVDICLAHNERSEAIWHAMNMADYQDKLDILKEIEAWSEAADVAFRLRDEAGLQFLAAKCNDSGIQTKISSYITQLHSHS